MMAHECVSGVAHDDPCGARTPWDLVSVFLCFARLCSDPCLVVVVVVVVLRFDNPLSLIFDSAIGFFSNYA